ncbi:MAG: short-chain dehydrogenase, partial [Actinomycetota bacterium]|nr:short-chain dehydrogenase [Actinomycetota bacterium]
MTDVPTQARAGVDPELLRTALAVFRELDSLPVDHPDAVAVREATARLFKQVKERRRRDRRDAELAHDAAVTAATATGAPGRIDDETRGLPLSSGTATTLAGT